MKIHIMIVLLICSFAVVMLGDVKSKRPDALLALEGTIGKIIGLDGEMLVGSEGFDKSVLKALSKIGSRERILLALLERSNMMGTPVQVYSYKWYMSFQWSNEQPEDAEHEAIIYYGAIKLQFDSDGTLQRVKASAWSETIPRVQGAPIEPKSEPHKPTKAR